MAKKGKKEVPAMSTSSLPDIVFMLLFFFMAATTMREVDPEVSVALPEAHEVTQLDKKDLVNIWVGMPLNAKEGEDALKIQLNDKTGEVNMVQEFVKEAAATKQVDDLKTLTINLRVDKEATVGLLTDVKQELRKADALTISYAARTKDNQ
ncbi:MAG: biopolymer transporter ExbD [Alistipes sp.]|nr:biopolymer transporter ExbD [Alistipes sp.]